MSLLGTPVLAAKSFTLAVLLTLVSPMATYAMSFSRFFEQPKRWERLYWAEAGREGQEKPERFQVAG